MSPSTSSPLPHSTCRIGERNRGCSSARRAKSILYRASSARARTQPSDQSTNWMPRGRRHRNSTASAATPRSRRPRHIDRINVLIACREWAANGCRPNERLNLPPETAERIRLDHPPRPTRPDDFILPDADYANPRHRRFIEELLRQREEDIAAQADGANDAIADEQFFDASTVDADERIDPNEAIEQLRAVVATQHEQIAELRDELNDLRRQTAPQAIFRLLIDFGSRLIEVAQAQLDRHE